MLCAGGDSLQVAKRLDHRVVRRAYEDIAPKVLELLVRKGQRAEVDVRERTGEVVREADEFVVPM